MTTASKETMLADFYASLRIPRTEPTQRWIRVRLGDRLVADSRRALLHTDFGPGVLPTYYRPIDDVDTPALVDEHDGPDGMTRW